MGNKRTRRPPAPPPLARSKKIPFRWLSCPCNGQIIHSAKINNLYFISMKTPLPDIFASSLGAQSIWTPQKAINKARSSIATEDTTFFAINVALNHEIVSKDDWELVGAEYARVFVPKDYSAESLDEFCDIINDKLEEIKETKKGPLVCLVYCGCGLNRVGFCISGYLARFYDFPLLEAIKKCDESSPRLIYRQKPLDMLTSIFGHPLITHGPSPDWIKLDEKVGAIGEIPLPLEKYNAIKKMSRKYIAEEIKDEALHLLSIAVKDDQVFKEKIFPKFSLKLWGSQSLNELRTKKHLMAFEPRGVKAFIVVLSSGSAYVVDMHCNVSELKVKCQVLPQSVASCVLIEEKKRGVFLMTDLLYLGSIDHTTNPLNERLSYLAHEFTDKLDPEPSDQYSLKFVFRPMAKLSNASKLRRDLSNLFAKCEGISFYDCSAPPGTSLFLPITCSAVLQFDYNGNDKAILYAKGEKFDLEPVSIYRSANPKFNALDGRTSRFEYDRNKLDWNPVAIGHNDPPASVEEVATIISFLSTNISYDDLFQQIDKITYEDD